MNRKLLWIILPITIFIIFVLFGFGFFTQQFGPPKMGTYEQIEINMIVEEIDKLCETDNDCVYVPTLCSECSCGDVVNEMYQQKYIDRYTEICENFEGKKCTIQCLGFIKCIKNKCARTIETE